ncbi:MAG: NUDIX domain-containing protein [Sphingobacteriaceae bacterium]|jgi:8-oxo-dGTP diphosphatase
MHRFNVRVYGILIKDGKVLVSDEYIKGNKITKFPGGGLEFGEGTIECIKREFIEEMQLPVEVISHFYTTDFFVSSAFSPNNQVISIYYLVRPEEEINTVISQTPHDYSLTEGAQSFRWIHLDHIKDEDLTLIIDKKVAELIRSSQKGL